MPRFFYLSVLVSDDFLVEHDHDGLGAKVPQADPTAELGHLLSDTLREE